MNIREIKKKLTGLGVWSDSMTESAKQLVGINERLSEMWDNVKNEGYTQTIVSREGNDRLIEHPLLKEINKLEATKVKVMDALLLTPAALTRAKIEKKIDDGFDDIETS